MDRVKLAREYYRFFTTVACDHAISATGDRDPIYFVDESVIYFVSKNIMIAAANNVTRVRLRGSEVTNIMFALVCLSGLILFTNYEVK